MTAPPASPPASGREVRTLLREATQQLSAITDTPRLDAELLMANALGVPRNDLLLRHLDGPAPDGFASLLQRRLAHEPIAYITGVRAFWTIELQVGPGALIPRPDSETLIEAAVAHFAAAPPATVLDLGTGPGTLLLAALDQWPDARGLGVDRSEAALGYARDNAARLGLTERARLVAGDWAAGIDERFDLILCNPPYVARGETLPAEVEAHEPRSALFAGPDGLDDYRRIVPQIRRILAPGGLAALEIGWTQADAVVALARQADFTTEVRLDLGGRPRAVLLT